MSDTNNHESLLQIIARLKKSINGINAIAFAGLGFTTFGTAYFIAREKLLDTELPILASAAISLLIPILIYTVFDSGLRKWLIVSLKAIMSNSFSSAKGGVKALAIGLVIVAFIRFGLTTCATVFSGYIAGDELVEEENTDDIERLYMANQEAQSEIDNSTNKEISSIRYIAATQGREIVNNAITSGSKKWQRLYNQKHGWFLKGAPDDSGKKNKSVLKYLAGIKKAKDQKQKLIADAESQIVKLNSSRLAIIEAKNNDSNLAAIAALKVKKAEKNEAKERRITFGLLTADIILSVVALITSILIAHIMNVDPSYEPIKESQVDLSEIPHQSQELFKKVINNAAIAVIKLFDLILSIVPVTVVKLHASAIAVTPSNITKSTKKTKVTSDVTEVTEEENPTSYTGYKLSHAAEVSLYKQNERLIGWTRRNYNRSINEDETTDSRAACKLRYQDGVTQLRELGLKVKINPETKRISITEPK